MSALAPDLSADGRALLIGTAAKRSTHEREKFHALEGLRGILALVVCMGHLGLTTAAAHLGVAFHFGRAVDVFFALSAFVLSYSSFYGQKTFGRFIIGRFARLYPLHLLTLLLMVALAGWAASMKNGDVLVQQLALLQNIGLPPNRWAFNYPSWSISVEFWLSIVFLLILQRPTAARVAAILAACLAIPAVFSGFMDSETVNLYAFFNTGMLRGIVGFAVGALAFLFYDRYLEYLPDNIYLSYALIALAGVAFVCDISALIFVYCFYVIIFFLLVMLGKHDQRIFLAKPWLVAIGSACFSIYLLHFPLFTIASRIFGDDRVRGNGKILLVAAIVVCSLLSRSLIEVPLQTCVLRLARPRQRQAPS